MPLFARGTSFEHLQIAFTKVFTVELMDISGLWGLNHWTVKELLYLLARSLFGVLKVKDDPDRTGRKNDKYCMYWNVAPDALPGSARIVHILD